MSEEYVSKELCEERSKRLEEMENDLNDVDKRIAAIEKLNIKLGVLVEQLTEESKQNKQAIHDLEMKPAKRYDYIVQLIIQWAVIGLLGLLTFFKH